MGAGALPDVGSKSTTAGTKPVRWDEAIWFFCIMPPGEVTSASLFNACLLQRTKKKEGKKRAARKKITHTLE